MVDGAPTHAFLEFFLPVLHTVFFPRHWLPSHINIVETMASGERGMNPLAMTIINPRKEELSNMGMNKPPHCTQLTELWGLGQNLSTN